MAKKIDKTFYTKARMLLTELFDESENCFRNKEDIIITSELKESANKLFTSLTKSYREVLLGCGLAKCIDAAINIKKPYVNLGDDAFNGRTLDEKVVNPFLQDKKIPCSKGPYLATFRRNVQFIPETATGLKDKDAYKCFLQYLKAFESSNLEQSKILIKYLLLKFIELRENSNIMLSRISRLNLEQYDLLIESLIEIPSGGLIPVFLTVAMFKTINISFNLNWVIEWQGINVADKASGAGGDITITKDGQILLAVEVTERPIERTRIVSTFNTKIAPNGIEDYLFFSTTTPPSEDAKAAAKQYFAQGHDINFLQVKAWIINSLGTIGTHQRSIFTTEFLNLLDQHNVPAHIKVKWNESINNIIN